MSEWPGCGREGEKRGRRAGTGRGWDGCAQASKQTGKCGAGAHLEARACPGCPVESTNRKKEVGHRVQAAGWGL